MTVFEVPRTDLVASLAATARGPAFLLTGPPGAGKSTLLRALRSRLLEDGTLPIYLDLLGAASSPDRLVTAALAALPAGPLAAALPSATRLRLLAEGGRQHGAEAVHALLELLASLTTAGGRPVVLLLDEATEIKSLAYFQGLRAVHEHFGAAMARRGAGVVLATSFPTLARKLWPALPAIAVPPLSVDELERSLAAIAPAKGDLGVALHRLTAGWPRHVRLLWPRLADGATAEAAWTSEMEAGGLLEQVCRQTFETLLLRSRGYGMSKAVLAAVAREEGLNLTALVARLGRTPGATRDYLQWLVDVDALRRTAKRYFFVDPVLRAWVRLHGQGPLPAPGRVRAAAMEMLSGPDPVDSAAPEAARGNEGAFRDAVPPDGETEEPRPSRRRDPLMEID
jgi:DNA polymerase III delta prime subunit